MGASKKCPHCYDGEAEGTFTDDGIEWYCPECLTAWTEKLGGSTEEEEEEWRF